MKNIYWKLQSVNQTDELEVGSKEFNLYREHYKKDYDTRELMTEAETVEHYKRNAWKNPLFSRIHSLTLAYVDKGKVRIMYITGKEKDILQTFLNKLKSDFFKDYVVSHFGAEYILPYLGTRLDKNGIRTTIPTGLQYKGLRPWNLLGFCVRSHYSGAGNYKNSLKELAWIYDLECSFIEPANEFEYFKSGKVKELKESAVDEIFTLVNVHHLMVGEDAILDLTIAEVFVDGVEEEKPTDFLELLHTGNKLSAEVRKGLKELLGKKKLTKADKVGLREILRGVYVQCAFEQPGVYPDSKDIIASKEREIDEFLDTI